MAISLSTYNVCKSNKKALKIDIFASFLITVEVQWGL